MEEPFKKKIEYIFGGLGLLIILASFIISYITQGKAGALTSSLLMLGIFTMFVPYVILEYTSYIKLKKAEENFPKFLRDYAEAINSGMNFTQAFDFVIKNDYGPLNEFLKRAIYRLSIGVPFPRVLEMMKDELKNSKMMSNSIGIIINAYNSGGDVGTTMSALAESVLEIKEIYAERASILHQQVTIMYAVFIVFLIIIFSLYYVLTPLTNISEKMSIGGLSFGSTNYCLMSSIKPLCSIGYVFGYSLEDNLTYFKILFFFMALIEAISIGAIAGILSGGNLTAGLKHIGILLSITLISFMIIM